MEVFVPHFYHEDNLEKKILRVFSNESDAVKKSLDFIAKKPYLFNTPIPLDCMFIDNCTDFEQMLNKYGNNTFGGSPGWNLQIHKFKIE